VAFLTASLVLPTAFCVLPLASWTVPSASSLAEPVARPAVALARPAAWLAAPFTLSPVLPMDRSFLCESGCPENDAEGERFPAGPVAGFSRIPLGRGGGAH
jgi:hypothetical protein